MNQDAPVKKQWSDNISNVVLCDFFYIFFIIYSVFAALSFLGGVYLFTTSYKMSLPMLIGLIINIILSFGISATSALFLYLICDRALKPQYSQFEDMPSVPVPDGFRN